MPRSMSILDDVLIQKTKELFDKKGPLKVFDLGAGTGKWAELLKPYYSVIDAVEIREPNIKQYELEKKYNKVINANVMDIDYEGMEYDLIGLGDIFEHLGIEDAKKLIQKLKNFTCFITLPFNALQGPEGGNQYEIHLQPDLNEEVMKERYPELTLEVVKGGKGFYTLNFNKEVKILAYISCTADYDGVVEQEYISVYRPTEFQDEPVNSIVKARAQKILMSIAHPEFDYYLYMDGNMKITDPDLIPYLIKELGDNDILFMQHPNYTTTEQEIETICSMPRFNYIHNMCREQYEYYKKQGFPDEGGLPATGLIFYKGGIDKKFFEDWFNDIRYRQPRDQVSVCYNLWKRKIKYKLLEGDIYNSPHWTVNGHK